MKRWFVITLLFYAIISCENKGYFAENEKMVLVKSNQFDYYDSNKIAVADFIETYVNILFDSSLEVSNSYWDSDFLVYSQGRFLKNGWSRDTIIKYPPKILSIRSISEKEYDVKLLFSYDNSPLRIHNLNVLKDPLNRFYFKDLLSENLKGFQSFTSFDNLFYYHPENDKRYGCRI